MRSIFVKPRWNWLATGLAGGAAGTTALNAATYLDMAARGRPSSNTPEQTIEKLAHKTGLAIPGQGDTRQNRLAGLGPLSGVATGLGVGVRVALARRLGLTLNPIITGVAAGAAAMAATDTSMAALGVSNPRSWSVTAWLSDAFPHLAYGVVTAAVVSHLDRR